MQGYANAPVWTGRKHGFGTRAQRMSSTFSRIRARAGQRVAAKRVASIANRTITNRAEKKHNHISINSNADLDTGGDLIKLTALGQGIDNHDRIGAYVTPVSIKFQYSMLPATNVNFIIVRMLIFQWTEPDDLAPPTPQDVLENTAGDNVLFSPYLQDNNNTRVLWDRLGWIAGGNTANFKCMTGKVLIPGRKMKNLKFTRGGGTTGSNQIYLLLFSSRIVADPDALKPNLIGISNLRYTDT